MRLQDVPLYSYFVVIRPEETMPLLVKTGQFEFRHAISYDVVTLDFVDTAVQIVSYERNVDTAKKLLRDARLCS